MQQLAWNIIFVIHYFVNYLKNIWAKSQIHRLKRMLMNKRKEPQMKDIVLGFQNNQLLCMDFISSLQ